MGSFRFLHCSLLVASIVSGICCVKTSASEDKLPDAIAAVARGSVAASNADSPSAVAAYFTPSAIIIDEISPYQWTGPNAAKRWWLAIDKQNRKYGIPKLHFAMHPLKVWHVDGNVAYVVVPLTITYVVQGQHGSVPGQWALTLRRTNGQWKITGAAWAEES